MYKVRSFKAANLSCLAATYALALKAEEAYVEYTMDSEAEDSEHERKAKMPPQPQHQNERQ